MDLYADPVATTSRAVLALCEQAQLPVVLHTVSLMKGEHQTPPLCELNPNRMVPVLVDGEFVLTEASAILRYLARGADCLYPHALREQAHVDELMAWFESNFYRDFGHQYVYPQRLPHHRRATEEATAATIAWGGSRSCRWLEVLDRHFLGHGGPYLLGHGLTIADFFGMSILSLGDLVQCRFRRYPNVRRWRESVEALPSWQRVNEAYNGFASALQGAAFVALPGDENADAA